MLKKFRVVSDLHLDINRNYPLKIEDDVFTVICGDTSGDPEISISWIKKNIKSGVGVSGNHLPYNDNGKTMEQLRQDLANAFPAEHSFTYLDAETGVYAKEVDGVLFVGSCGYTDFKIKHETWNPDGDQKLNKMCSMWNMNDYRWGMVNDATSSRGKKPLHADNYLEWNEHALKLFDKLLTENEKSADPKLVVLITHYAWIADTLQHSWYIDNYISSQRAFNYSSYASDLKSWILSHPSIKCYCYGHIHAISKDKRSFYIGDDKHKVLVVNNARGYVRSGHDQDFNLQLFVNTSTWEVEEEPKKTEAKKDAKDIEKLASAFIF